MHAGGCNDLDDLRIDLRALGDPVLLTVRDRDRVRALLLRTVAALGRAPRRAGEWERRCLVSATAFFARGDQAAALAQVAALLGRRPGRNALIRMPALPDVSLDDLASDLQPGTEARAPRSRGVLRPASRSAL